MQANKDKIVDIIEDFMERLYKEVAVQHELVTGDWTPDDAEKQGVIDGLLESLVTKYVNQNQ